MAVYTASPIDTLGPKFARGKSLDTLLQSGMLKNVGLLVCSKLVDHGSSARGMNTPQRLDILRHLDLLRTNPGLVSGLLVADKKDTILTLFTTPEPKNSNELKSLEHGAAELPAEPQPGQLQAMGVTAVQLFCDSMALIAIPPAGAPAYGELSRFYATTPA